MKTVSAAFGRADPGVMPSLTARCDPGQQVVSGGVDTEVLDGNANDLMRIELLSTHPVAGTGWQATSVVATRLSQSANLVYTVTAYCIPAP